MCGPSIRPGQATSLTARSLLPWRRVVRPSMRRYSPTPRQPFRSLALVLRARFLREPTWNISFRLLPRLQQDKESDVHRSRSDAGHPALRDYDAGVGFLGEHAEAGRKGKMAIPAVLLGLLDRRAAFWFVVRVH